MTVQSSAQTLYDALLDHLREPPGPDPDIDPARRTSALARQAAAIELRDLVGGPDRLRVWWLQLPQDRRALDGHRGALGRRRVDRIALEGEQDSHEAGSARRMWRRRQDYRVWMAEG